MAEIVPVVSEALEAQVRALLPSQRGFGEDLQASNVILPVIDLTSAAEGSAIPVSMQQALAFGSQTAFDIQNTTTVIANTPGFYRIFGTASTRVGSPVFGQNASFTMSDGFSSKTVWGYEYATGSDSSAIIGYDFIVFLSTGESISGVSTNTQTDIIGSSRQIADVNGVLVNPAGFTPQ